MNTTQAWRVKRLFAELERPCEKKKIKKVSTPITHEIDGLEHKAEESLYSEEKWCNQEVNEICLNKNTGWFH